MNVLSNGYFSQEFSSDFIPKGLRVSSNLGIGSPSITLCDGCMAEREELYTSDLDIASFMSDDLIVSDDFPFPQVFIFDSVTVVCNRTSILEWDGTSLVSAISTTSGSTWSGIGKGNFVFMTNGLNSYVRDPNSLIWAVSTEIVCKTVLNYNGQLICGNII